MIGNLRRQIVLAALSVGCLLATSAMPFSVSLPCEAVRESNMWVGPSIPLADWGGLNGIGIAPTGVVVDGYRNSAHYFDGSVRLLPTPIPRLHDFTGARVLHCASGSFFAVPGKDWDDLNEALVASSLLNPEIAQGVPIELSDLRRAVLGAYPDAIELIETEQTCGCSEFFDSFRPVDQTRYVDRVDVND